MAGFPSPAPAAVSVGRKDKFRVLGAKDADTYAKAVTHIEAVSEGEGLSGSVYDRNLRVVVALFIGRDLKAEDSIGPKGMLLLKDGVLSPVIHLDAHAGAGKSVARVACDLAAYGHFGAHHIEICAAVKAKVEGREHEFVYPETVPGKDVLCGNVHYLNAEISIPEAPGEGKAAACRAKVPSYEPFCLKAVALRVIEGDIQFPALAYVHL